MELIGKMLIAEYNKAQVSSQQIIYASPLRTSGKDLENFQVDPNKNLQKFTSDLNKGIKIVGSFNAGSNHWISYLLFKDQNDHQIKCIYKDSLGHKRHDFVQTFLKAFYADKSISSQHHDNIIICATEKVAEQMIQFEPMNNHISCGIFALKNMIILADIAKYLNQNTINNFKELMKSVKFFSPGDNKDTYQANISTIRIEFSDKYRDYVSQEAINNTIARVNVNNHSTEAEAFAKLFNIKKEYIEICSIFDKPKEYAYKINYGSNTELHNHYTQSFTQRYIEFQDDIMSKVLLIKSETIYSWLSKYMTILNQNELGAIIELKNLIDHNNTIDFIIDTRATQDLNNLIDDNLCTKSELSKDYISQMINHSINNYRPITSLNNTPYENNNYNNNDYSWLDEDLMGDINSHQ